MHFPPRKSSFDRSHLLIGRIGSIFFDGHYGFKLAYVPHLRLLLRRGKDSRCGNTGGHPQWRCSLLLRVLGTSPSHIIYRCGAAGLTPRMGSGGLAKVPAGIFYEYQFLLCTYIHIVRLFCEDSHNLIFFPAVWREGGLSPHFFFFAL